MPLTNATQIARSKGDPQVLSTGHSSLSGTDQLGRLLGWFSIGLGVTELMAPGYLARTLGLKGKEGLIRAYGAREIMSGLPTLSPDRSFGLASRIAGDVLDLGTLAVALNDDNPKRNNAVIAMALVAGVTLLDIVAYSGTKGVHHRSPKQRPRLLQPQRFSPRSSGSTGPCAPGL